MWQKDKWHGKEVALQKPPDTIVVPQNSRIGAEEWEIGRGKVFPLDNLLYDATKAATVAKIQKRKPLIK